MPPEQCLLRLAQGDSWRDCECVLEDVVGVEPTTIRKLRTIVGSEWSDRMEPDVEEMGSTRTP